MLPVMLPWPCTHSEQVVKHWFHFNRLFSAGRKMPHQSGISQRQLHGVARRNRLVSSSLLRLSHLFPIRFSCLRGLFHCCRTACVALWFFDNFIEISLLWVLCSAHKYVQPFQTRHGWGYVWSAGPVDCAWKTCRLAPRNPQCGDFADHACFLQHCFSFK